MSVATLSLFESRAFAKGAEAKNEDEDSATVYSVYSNATTVKMNNRSRTFAGKAVPNDDQRRRAIAREIQRVMVDQQLSDLRRSVGDDTSTMNFFTDRAARFPSNANNNEIVSLAFEYCAGITASAGTAVENAPTAGAEAAAPGNDIDSESSKTKNAPTAGAEAAAPGNDIDSESSKTKSTLSVDQQPSDLLATLFDHRSMVNFFRDRGAQFPSNAGKYEIASLAFKYFRFDPENTIPADTALENAPTAGAEAAAAAIASLAFEYFRFDPENTVPAGTAVENAPTAGAEAAAPGDDIESESSKTTSTLSSNFPNAPTGDLVDTTPVSASDGPHADDYGASAPVIDIGETNSSTRQTVVEQVRSGVAGLG